MDKNNSNINHYGWLDGQQANRMLFPLVVLSVTIIASSINYALLQFTDPARVISQLIPGIIVAALAVLCLALINKNKSLSHDISQLQNEIIQGDNASNSISHLIYSSSDTHFDAIPIDCTIVVWPKTDNHAAQSKRKPTIIAKNKTIAQLLGDDDSIRNWVVQTTHSRLGNYIDRLAADNQEFTATCQTTDDFSVTVRGFNLPDQTVLFITPAQALAQAPAQAPAQALAQALAVNSNQREQHYEGRSRQAELFEMFFNKSPHPMWLNIDDKYKFNPSYNLNSTIKGASDVATAHPIKQLDDKAIEWLTAKRDKVVDSLATVDQTDDKSEYQAKMLTVNLETMTDNGQKLININELITHDGSVGMAIDLTGVEIYDKDIPDKQDQKFERALTYHAHTLNMLNTAVAIFNRKRKLVFWNKAYASLWQLDDHFLDSNPRDEVILDRLREAELLPMQSNYRAWQSELLKVYDKDQTREQVWHLPNGKVLRVIATPNPRNGITYIYENITDQLKLEGQYHTLTQIQRETLNQLAEAVVVFAPDGRVRLANTAFNEMWFDGDAAENDNIHIKEMTKAIACKFHNANKELSKKKALKYNTALLEHWHNFAASITSLDDARKSVSGRICRSDNQIIDYTLLPLPDEAIMIVFRNVTSSINVQKMLKERNAALETADRLKDSFLQHVSYELRTPLTNIIGFTSLLNDKSTGTMTAKQQQYIDYISTSSLALETLINDILDLTVVQAGAMQLDYKKFNVDKAVDAAIRAVSDRLKNKNITIKTKIDASISDMIADQKRVRQILFKVISNAIRFSPDNSEIKLTCNKVDNNIKFIITDNGVGVKKELENSVWQPFTSNPDSDGRRSTGLGLSIVKSFVELHKGTVSIANNAKNPDIADKKGATVTITIPIGPGKNIDEDATNFSDILNEKVA